MAYIEYKEVMVTKMVCNHPKVKRIWEYGGLAETPTSGEMIRRVVILLNDGSRHEYGDTENSDALKMAEQFISTLPTE